MQIETKDDGVGVRQLKYTYTRLGTYSKSGEIVIPIDTKDKYQNVLIPWKGVFNITVTAIDYVGNVTEKEFKDVRLRADEVEDEYSQDAEKAGGSVTPEEKGGTGVLSTKDGIAIKRYQSPTSELVVINGKASDKDEYFDKATLYDIIKDEGDGG